MGDIEKNVDFSAIRIKEASPGMWDDLYVENRPFLKTCGYQNDFTDWVADSWTITEVGTSTQTLLDARNGILRLTSGASDNDGSQLQLGGTGDSETVGECFLPAAGKNLWFECRVRSDDVTEHDFFLGLHVQDTTVVAGRGSDYIGFRTDEGDALLDIECASGSSASSQTSVHTLVNDTWVTLGFKVTGTEKIEFYVNNVLKATLSTNIPTAEMKLTLAHLTGEGNAVQLDIDYVVVIQDR